MATQATLKQVQEIYIGLLGRAADLEGLNYWAGEITDGKITIEQVRANIVNEQAEYAANLGAISSRAILVATLYQNMFNRAPDSEGLEYWVNGGGKTVNADQLVLALSNGASAVDRLALDNRADVANFYTTNATFNVSSAAAVLLNVNSTLASVTTAKASISSDAESPAVAGQTFTLTANTDALQGTADNDTFNSVLQGANADGTTIQPGDVINGGAGTDTLNITIAGAAGATAISAVQTNSVERVLVNNFSTTNGTNAISTDLMEGLTTVGLRSSSAEGDTSFTGMRALVGAEMRNGNGDLTLTYSSAAVAGTADTQALTVSNLSGGTFTANGAETIAITSELVKSKITNVSSDKLKTVTVAGAADLEITGNLTFASPGSAIAPGAVVDASAFTGNLEITLGNHVMNVKGGSGDDTINVTTLTKDDVIDGGEGDDALVVFATGATPSFAVGTADEKGALYNVSNVETIVAAVDVGATATFNLNNTVGVTTAAVAAFVKTVDFNGLGVTPDTPLIFTLNGQTIITNDIPVGADTDIATAFAAAINALPGFTASVIGVGNDAVALRADVGTAIEFGDFVNDNIQFVPFGISDYGDVSFTNLTGQEVQILSANDVSASLKDASGSDDVLNINLESLSADKGFNQSIRTITANNIETINLNVEGMSDGKVKTVGTLNASSMKTLNITGDSDLTITSMGNSTAAATIDGSTSTGDLSLTIIDLAANLPDARTIKTGAGNDVINMGALLTKDVTIDGGGNSLNAAGKMGKDLVTATGAIGTIVTAAALKIANVENIEIATDANSNFIDAAGITGAENIAFSSTGGTVKITNLAAGTAIGLGIGAVGANATTFDLALADATGDADSITIAYSDTLGNAATTNTLKIAAAVETLNIVATKEAGNNQPQTLVNTDMAAKNIVVTAGHAGDTLALGTLNKATTNVNASKFAGGLTVTTAAAGAVTVSANGKVANNIVTGAGADTITLAGEIAAIVHTINGGGGKNTLNATLGTAAASFANVTNIETINLTVGGNKQATVGNATGLNAAKVINITGGDSLSTFTVAAGGTAFTDAEKTIDASTFGGTIDLNFALNALDADVVIKGGASGKDKVSTLVNTKETIKSMTGVETLVVSASTQTGGIDLVNVTGLSTLETTFTGATAKLTVDNLATGVAVKATTVTAGDNLVVNMTDKSAADNVLGLELAGANSLNFDAAGVETLNIKASVGTTVDLAGVTATEETGNVTVNVSGSGALTLSALSSETNVVNASAATGAITLESGARAATAMTITGGTGGDTISMRNAGDVLNGGLGNDTLKVNANFILGGIQVDLSSTTDQVTTFNGSANAAAQIGFENVDLSDVTGAFGADITAAATGSIITGTRNADNITGGKGNDTIIGGAGADVLTGGAGDDTFVFAAGDSGITVATADTITDFGTGDNLLSLGLAGSVAPGATFNYVEAGAAVADFTAALAAANTALAANGNGQAFENSIAVTRYAFEFDADNGYLFIDNDADGAAEMVIILTGIDDGGIAATSIIA